MSLIGLSLWFEDILNFKSQLSSVGLGFFRSEWLENSEGGGVLEHLNFVWDWIIDNWIALYYCSNYYKNLIIPDQFITTIFRLIVYLPLKTWKKLSKSSGSLRNWFLLVLWLKFIENIIYPRLWLQKVPQKVPQNVEKYSKDLFKRLKYNKSKRKRS